MKVEVDKLDINELVNITTNLDNLKAKVDELNVDNMKNVPIDLTKLSGIVIKIKAKFEN